MNETNTCVREIKREWLKFLENVITKEVLENLTLPGHIESKSNREEYQITYLVGINE